MEKVLWFSNSAGRKIPAPVLYVLQFPSFICILEEKRLKRRIAVLI